MWNVLNATKRDIMPINALNLRPKMVKHPLKCEKWKIFDLKLIQKLSRFAIFEFDIRILKNKILILL